MFVHRIKDTNHTDYKYFYFFNLHQIEITLYDILMNCCLSILHELLYCQIHQPKKNMSDI